jgi:hypothetical protein
VYTTSFGLTPWARCLVSFLILATLVVFITPPDSEAFIFRAIGRGLFGAARLVGGGARLLGRGIGRAGLFAFRAGRFALGGPFFPGGRRRRF